MYNLKHVEGQRLFGWLCSLIRGAGQVMFQKSVGCGLLFLVGIFYGAIHENRIEVAWGALVGLLSATGAGFLLRMEPDEGAQGLWGFNGILTGCALMTFLRPTLLCWGVLILFSASTVWVRRGMNRMMAPWKINSLTMPFILMTWLSLLAARTLQGLTIEGLSDPGFPIQASAAIQWSPRLLIKWWLSGISQVFLLNAWPTGLLFLFGLWIANRWTALWAALASALSLLLALCFGAPGSALSEGLYGFSPVLTGIALGAIFYRPSWRVAVWCTLGIIMTFFLQAACNMLLRPFGLPSLTFPFCLTTWLFLLPMFKLEGSPHKSHVMPDPDHTDWSAERKFHLD